MKFRNSTLQSIADLAALSAAAQGSAIPTGVHAGIEASEHIEDPSREARIAELKAKFEAGILPVDEQAIAAKLIQSHTTDSGSSQK